MRVSKTAWFCQPQLLLASAGIRPVVNWLNQDTTVYYGLVFSLFSWPYMVKWHNSGIIILCNASVNLSCAQLSPGISIFLPWMANSQGWGLLSCQIPWGGDEKRGQMPHPPSTLQHFSLIAQLNSAILSIFNFLFQLTSSFVIVLGF